MGYLPFLCHCWPYFFIISRFLHPAAGVPGLCLPGFVHLFDRYDRVCFSVLMCGRPTPPHIELWACACRQRPQLMHSVLGHRSYCSADDPMMNGVNEMDAAFLLSVNHVAY